MSRRLLLTAAAVAVVTVALVSGCGGSDKSSRTAASTETGSEAGCAKVDSPEPRDESRRPPTESLDPTKTWTATFETSCGSFAVRLDVNVSPNTTASFVSLARSRFYDNTIFHRVVAGFVIQGGDPSQNGAGGPGYTVVDKPPADATYPLGTVAMAKTATEPPGTAGSQFFVMTGDGGLPPEYALLGKVIRGLDTVRRIDALGDPTESSPLPTRTVLVRRIVVSSS